MPHLRAARLSQIDPLTLFALLRLRVDVFVVEQACAYPELDDVDPDAGTLHLWMEVEGAPVATLRTFSDESGVAHLGRVATRVDQRGQGYAAALVTEALRRFGDRPVVIGAQTYLEGWYAGFGFRRDGEDYLEDGIPHLPMRRG
jgi:ElaA protein